MTSCSESSTSPSGPRARWLPALTFALAIVYASLLALQTRPHVYFSGDGGLKALMARQEAAAGLRGIRPDLVIPAPAWVNELWDSGLFPFGRPFVYEIAGKRFIQYPIIFPILSAPFYAALGWRGLYALPFLGVIGTLGGIWLISRRLEFGPSQQALALGIAAFASPLTPYGAMYWEHTPALAAITLGGALVLGEGERSFTRPLCGGFLAVAGGAMRPELLLFVAVLGSVLLVWPTPLIPRHSACIALASGSLTALLLPTLNYLTTGTALGMHAQQMIPGVVPYLEPPLHRYETLLALLIEWFPAAPLALGVLLLPRRDTFAFVRRLVLTALLFVAIVPLAVPSSGGLQWGPRFLLIVVPVAALAMASLASARSDMSPGLKAGGTALLVAALAAGTWRNVVQAPSELNTNYRLRVLPIVQFIADQPEEIVAVTHQWIAQDLSDLIPSKTLFRLQGLDLDPRLSDRDVQVTTPDDARRLADSLYKRGLRSYFVVAYRSQSIPERVIGDELVTVFTTAALNDDFSVFYATIGRAPVTSGLRSQANVASR